MVKAWYKCGRAAPATLIPSREAAPPAPSAKGMGISIEVGLNTSNLVTSDSILVTESNLTQLVTQLVTKSPLLNGFMRRAQRCKFAFSPVFDAIFTIY